MIPMAITMTNPAPGQILPYCSCSTVYAEKDWPGSPDVEALHAAGVPQREASLRLWVPRVVRGHVMTAGLLFVAAIVLLVPACALICKRLEDR